MNDDAVKVDALQPERLLWRFDALANFDQPFHTLIAAYGVEAIMSLDALVLEDTRNAARNAVKYHRDKLIESGIDESLARTRTMALAGALGEALKDQSTQVSHEPLLPEEAVFQPIERPSM